MERFYKLASVSPSVRPYVRNAKLEKLDHEFYLIFSVKLGDHKRRKVTEPDFSGKFLFGPNLGIYAQISPN